jgi:MinD-like ATPase involved in chromosome partitioning or flagellar assembly
LELDSLFPLRSQDITLEGGLVLLALWSPKGGSGTSVTAAALALTSAARRETRLVDLSGDQPAILGLPPLISPASLVAWLVAGPAAPSDGLDDVAVPVLPGLALLPGGPEAASAPPEAGAALAVALRDAGLAVVDVGSGADVHDGAGRAVVDVADSALLVVRPCYLALRRAVADPRLGSSAGAILVEEPGRSLDADDIAAVLGLPVIGRIPVRAEIARAVDAGVLRDRLPASLATAAGGALDRAGRLAGGRWAA